MLCQQNFNPRRDGKNLWPAKAGKLQIITFQAALDSIAIHAGRRTGRQIRRGRRRITEIKTVKRCTE